MSATPAPLHQAPPRRLTLVEGVVFISVMLMVIAVLAPTIHSHREMTRIIRAKEQVRVIGEAVVEYVRDIGLTGEQLASAPGGPEVLDGPGRLPQESDIGGGQRWGRGRHDQLDAHLLQPSPRITGADENQHRRWYGPYLHAPVSADPWGNRYMVNICYFHPDGLAIDGRGNVKRAVFVISAGPNRRIDTPFEQPITTATVRGDDIVYRLQ